MIMQISTTKGADPTEVGRIYFIRRDSQCLMALEQEHEFPSIAYGRHYPAIGVR